MYAEHQSKNCRRVRQNTPALERNTWWRFTRAPRIRFIGSPRCLLCKYYGVSVVVWQPLTSDGSLSVNPFGGLSRTAGAVESRLSCEPVFPLCRPGSFVFFRWQQRHFELQPARVAVEGRSCVVLNLPHHCTTSNYFQ